MSFGTISTYIRELIRSYLEKDPLPKELMNLVKECKTRQFWFEDVLFKTKWNYLYVPKAENLQRTLMKEHHDTLWASHPGWQRTHVLLKQGYYWS